MKSIKLNGTIEVELIGADPDFFARWRARPLEGCGYIEQVLRVRDCKKRPPFGWLAKQERRFIKIAVLDSIFSEGEYSLEVYLQPAQQFNLDQAKRVFSETIRVNQTTP